MRFSPRRIYAVTLFVESLDDAKCLYQDVFGLTAVHEDPDSAVFRIGKTLINLLAVTAAPDLIAPAVVASRQSGSRFQFTVPVDDVDASCAELTQHGVQLLNGPIDRPWGVRTASFMDRAAIYGRSRVRRRLVAKSRGVGVQDPCATAPIENVEHRLRTSKSIQSVRPRSFGVEYYPEHDLSLINRTSTRPLI